MRGVVDLEVDRVGVEGRVAGVEPQVDDVRPLRADDRREDAERAGPVLDLDADPRGAAFRIVAPGAIDPLDVLAVDRSEERRLGKRVSVRVDLGGTRILKKKKKN